MSEFSDKIPLGFGYFSITHPKSLVDNLMIKRTIMKFSVIVENVVSVCPINHIN
jgi:hypothetical protein